jgi:hypothetical protein
MSGGLVQIVSHGTMDLTLTGNPEITFFNIVYRRYTNFGILLKELAFDNDTQFETTSIITIPKTGQLLSKLILKIDLPEVNFDEINLKMQDENANKYYSYYDSFIYFINKLKNIVNNFFATYTFDNTNYSGDMSNFILKYLNLNDFDNFFISISSFFNDLNSVYTSILTQYYNASLFKIDNGELVFIYKNWNNKELNFNIFKETIYKNIEILDNLNGFLYEKLLKITASTNLFKISWKDEIALNLFDKIDFFIGSNKINSLSEFYIKNYGELYYKNKNVYNKLVGNDINLSNNLKSKTVYLVIPFWFNKNYGLSVPLGANYYSPIQIKLHIKKFEECIKIQVEDTISDNEKFNLLTNILQNYYNEYNKLKITMIAEYIFLDSLETKKFAESSHEYLITQTQELVFDNLTMKGSYGLDFYHCCKELIWNLVKKFEYEDVFIKNESIDPSIFYYQILYDSNVLFNLNKFVISLIDLNDKINKSVNIDGIIELISYKNNDVSTFIRNEININGTLFSNEKTNFYKFLHPYIYYNSLSPKSNTNVYSFSLNPTEFQPAGSVNFGKIPTICLLSVINPKLEKHINKYKLIVDTTNYNVLRFIGGVVGLAYTYNY